VKSNVVWRTPGAPIIVLALDPVEKEAFAAITR
jgi:hypothetical protein